MAKSPKAFNRLYVNMIKAGEAGGALEVILQRLAEFRNGPKSLKRKVKGAMIYPVVVVIVAVGILTFIMIKIVPAFEKIFKDFGLKLPAMTAVADRHLQLHRQLLVPAPGHPDRHLAVHQADAQVPAGRMGWDMFMLKMPVFGPLGREEHRRPHHADARHAGGQRRADPRRACTSPARPPATPLFERLYGKVNEAIREGESIAKPMKENSQAGLPPGGHVLLVRRCWATAGAHLLHAQHATIAYASVACSWVPVVHDAHEQARGRRPGGEHGRRGRGDGRTRHDALQGGRHLRRRSQTLTDSLMSLLEPLLIIFLGGVVGFIVISLFMPLVDLISKLS